MTLKRWYWKYFPPEKFTSINMLYYENALNEARHAFRDSGYDKNSDAYTNYVTLLSLKTWVDRKYANYQDYIAMFPAK